MVIMAKGASGILAPIILPEVSKEFTEEGIRLLKGRKYRSAAECFCKAIAADPQSARAFAGMGGIYQVRHDFERAIHWYQLSLDIDKTHTETRVNYARALLLLARLDEALVQAQVAFSLETSALTLQMLADAYNARGESDRGLQHLNALIRHESNSNVLNGLVELGFIHLQRGEFSAGWELYEFRVSHLPQSHPLLQLPRWRGEPLHGKSITVYSEQGLGDIIQFSRFVEDVANLGGKVTFVVPLPLRLLFRTLRGAHRVVSYSQVNEVDYAVRLLSLPHVLKLHSDTQFRGAPYLTFERPEAALSSYAAPQPSAFNIGIAWTGNSMLHSNLRRSIPLKLLAPLGSLPGVFMRSLIKEPVALQELEYTASYGFSVAHDPVDIADLTTCAAIEDMDLILSVDTSIAHLAGALGKPVWLMVPYGAEWRWQLDRSDSPWYSTMRIFRQTRLGDWEGVIEQVRTALQQKMLEPNIRSTREAGQDATC
jgi:tetratricopeptide (TPR) repeat protein